LLSHFYDKDYVIVSLNHLWSQAHNTNKFQWPNQEQQKHKKDVIGKEALPVGLRKNQRLVKLNLLIVEVGKYPMQDDIQTCSQYIYQEPPWKFKQYFEMKENENTAYQT
jgi:hypothetical protein